MAELLDNGGAGGCSVAARGGGERECEMDYERVGQARGVFKSWSAMPKRPRRVASTVRRPVTGDAMRPTSSEPTEHCSSPFSDPIKPDSATSTR